MGGSAAINLGGMKRLQEWPRCNSVNTLSQMLDDWRHCLEKYNVELLNAPKTLYHMLLQVIPADFEDELLTRPEVDTWQKVMAWCKRKTAYKRTKALAELARKPATSSRISALLSESPDAGAAESRPHEAPDDAPPPWAQTLINALGAHAPVIAAMAPPPPNGGRPVGARDRGRDVRRNGTAGRDRSRSSSTESNKAIRMSVKFKGC